jgi:hypothetical protein
MGLAQRSTRRNPAKREHFLPHKETGTQNAKRRNNSSKNSEICGNGARRILSTGHFAFRLEKRNMHGLF